MTSAPHRVGHEVELRWGRSKIGCDRCKRNVLAGFEVRVERKKVATLCRTCAQRPLVDLVAEYG